MDFSNRGNQQSPAASRPSVSPAEPTNPVRGSRKSSEPKNKWTKIAVGAILGAVGALMIAVLAIVVLPGVKAEDSFVNTDRLQAVFLTNDQVYFGNIDQLNSKYLVLTNIYYLQTSSSSSTASTDTSSANNVKLVKLGCELHKPYDKMIINRSEVEFWENLQSGGQVATAVTQYAKQNPNNTCSSSSSTGGAATTNNVQGGTSTTSNSATTNSTTTKTP